MKKKTINGIPKSETIKETWKRLNGDVFYITCKEDDSSMFFIYKMNKDVAEKLGKNKSPIELINKYIYER